MVHMIAYRIQYHALQSAIIKINLHFIGVETARDRIERHVMECLIEFNFFYLKKKH